MKTLVIMILILGNVISASASCEGICSYLKPETNIVPQHILQKGAKLKANTWNDLIENCKILVSLHSGQDQSNIVVTSTNQLSELTSILDSGNIVLRVLGNHGKISLRGQSEFGNLIGPTSEKLACIND